MYDLLRERLIALHGPALGTFIVNRLARMVRRAKDPCMDNLRIGFSDDDASLAAYVERKRRGCCAAVDERFRFERDGRTCDVLIGFNYGH